MSGDTHRLLSPQSDKNSTRDRVREIMQAVEAPLEPVLEPASFRHAVGIPEKFEYFGHLPFHPRQHLVEVGGSVRPGDGDESRQGAKNPSRR